MQGFKGRDTTDIVELMDWKIVISQNIIQKLDVLFGTCRLTLLAVLRICGRPKNGG